MARARNIKPGFFSNEDLAECSPWARLCFAGLWTLADREGRLEDRPKRIKGELFRFDTIEVEPLLQELERFKFIIRYVVDGQRFIQVAEFKAHQTPHYSEKPSVIKPPGFQESKTYEDDQPPREHQEESEKQPASRGGRNPLNPDSLIPDSLIPEEIPTATVTELAASAQTPTPPTPPPAFLGDENIEAMNGKHVVPLSASWELPAEWGFDAERLGWRPTDIGREAERFRQYWTAGKGAGTRRGVQGWRQSWSNWLGKAERINR